LDGYFHWEILQHLENSQSKHINFCHLRLALMQLYCHKSNKYSKYSGNRTSIRCMKTRKNRWMNNKYQQINQKKAQLQLWICKTLTLISSLQDRTNYRIWKRKKLLMLINKLNLKVGMHIKRHGWMKEKKFQRYC
jgi:SRSO17 transposase